MTDPMIVAMSDDKQFRVRLWVDEGYPNPREESLEDLTVYAVTVPDRHYADVAGAGPLAEAWERVKTWSPHGVELFSRYARIFHGAVTMHDAPHDGPEVIWYMLPGGMAGVSDPMTYMKGWRDEYRAWASGEVFSYVIEEAVDWVRGDGQDGSKSTWEPVDDDEGSAWGLIGYEFAEEEAKREFSAFLQRNA